MGKNQKSKRNRKVREGVRNYEAAEDVYTGKVKVKRVHYNKYEGDEFKAKKKKGKHPITIDNKINKAIEEVNIQTSTIMKETQKKFKRIDNILIGLFIITIIGILVIGVTYGR